MSPSAPPSSGISGPIPSWPPSSTPAGDEKVSNQAASYYETFASHLCPVLFSNPYLNLSHLVTALLIIILGQNMSSSFTDQVPLASSILALDRWATPVNQLRCQTLRHLRKFVSHERGAISAQAQYGAITCLSILGPPVLCGILSPWPRHLWEQLDKQEGVVMVPMLWAAVRKAGATILNYWLSQREQHSDAAWELYGELYRYYGPSRVQEVQLI